MARDRFIEPIPVKDRGSDRDFKSSQSPRANRSSTDNADKYGKGEVRIGVRQINKSGGEGNEGAWQHPGKNVSSQKDV